MTESSTTPKMGLYGVDEAIINLLEDNRMHMMESAAIRVCPPPVIHAPRGHPRFGASVYVSISPMAATSTAIKASSMAQSSYSPIAPVGRFLSLSPIPTHYSGGSQVRFSWTASNAEIDSLCDPSLGEKIFAEDEEGEEGVNASLSSSTKSMIASRALMFHPIQLSSFRQVSATALDYYHTPRNQHHHSSTTIRSGASQSSSRGKDLENMMQVASILTAMPHTPPPPGKTRNDDDDWVPSGGPTHAPSKAKKKGSGTKSTSRLELTTPTDLDVLSGRGGETNKHEGNLLFREEARKLRDVYRANGTSRAVKHRLSLVRATSVYIISVILFYALALIIHL